MVQALLERGCDGDLAEAEAAIDRMESLPVDFRWAASDIAVLRLRALLSQSRGEEAAYQDSAQRYRAMTTSLGFEGHMQWAEAMPRRGPFTRSAGRILKTLTRLSRSNGRRSLTSPQGARRLQE